MMITGWTVLTSSHVTFFFLSRIQSIHIRFEENVVVQPVLSVLISSNFIGLNSDHWSTQFFSWRCQKTSRSTNYGWWRQSCLPLIITVATAANLRSLDLSLIINLMVDWPKFESFLCPFDTKFNQNGMFPIQERLSEHHH